MLTSVKSGCICNHHQSGGSYDIDIIVYNCNRNYGHSCSAELNALLVPHMLNVIDVQNDLQNGCQ